MSSFVYIKTQDNMSIVCSDDDDEKSWCNSPCDALLIERRDGSMICSCCGREYLPDSVKKYKDQLQPNKSRYDRDGPLVVSMPSYADGKKKKKPSVFDREDRAWLAQGKGRSIIAEEEYLPEPERRS
jgi:hypothetical protein